MAIGESGYEFIKEHATKKDNGEYHIKMKDYLSFMKDHGIDRSILEATSEAHNELVNGLYRFNANNVLDGIEEAKKANDPAVDPAKVRVSTVLHTLDGTISLKSDASKTFPNPSQGGKITKFMTSTMKISNPSSFDDDLMNEIQDRVKEALGL